MDFDKIAVFFYCATLNHFLADFLSHRKKKGAFIFLHCFLYAMLFMPLFWWLGVNLLWLFLLFSSHLAIDSQWKRLLSFFNNQTKEQEKLSQTTLIIFTVGLDQVLHLSMLVVIAFTF
ncbi:MAG: DUF3307 domain-containing protein [Candidatus Nealsonbacteria bacterium]|nr:DUF3307 domain-containing protein [Candidatus Nealsonbacteria bacterium]